MSTIAHFSLDHYEHMVETGAFTGKYQKRVELLRGELCMMSPIGASHSHIVTLLTDWSYHVVPRTDLGIRVQNPIRIPIGDSEPEPDLAWVHRKEYSDHHPGPEEVLLVIEVADSSLETDRTEKLSIYAEAGIADYWIVNLMDKQIEVYRQPLEQTYRSRNIYREDDAVSPLALPSAEITPSQLFPNR
jgi:Uma2 family endonuclease